MLNDFLKRIYYYKHISDNFAKTNAHGKQL